MAKKDLVKVKTPIGELRYVQISGKGKENYDKDGYEYVAHILLTGEQSKELRAEIDKVIGEVKKDEFLKSKGYRQMKKDANGKLFTPSNRKKDGEDVDLYDFNFRTSTHWPAEGDKPPAPKLIGVYNKNGAKVDIGNTRIGNGSIGAIEGMMERTVYNGDVSCSLYLKNVQIAKLVKYVEEADFDEVEGDFEGLVDEETGFVGQPDENSKPKL